MTLQLTIPSMACSACADTIVSAVQNLDPEAKVQPNLETKVVKIETKIGDREVKEAIASAGYPVN